MVNGTTPGELRRDSRETHKVDLPQDFGLEEDEDDERYLHRDESRQGAVHDDRDDDRQNKQA